MNLNDYYNQITKEILIENESLKEAILALHESATKLYQAEAKQKDKLETRAMNALISAFNIMKEIGIKNPEECLEKRIKELRNENK